MSLVLPIILRFNILCFFFKQKTAYEMRISDWSSDVCSSDLLYQIKRCSAPCVGRISEADYAELAGDAQDFLAGKSTKVQRKLGAAMQSASDAMDFELAAVYRDRLKALTFIQGSQAINAEGLGDADIFAMASKGGSICIQAFFIRGGQNWGHRSFFPVHTEDLAEEEVLESFMAQFYEEVPAPRMILADRVPLVAELLTQALSERPGAKVRIDVPQRGDRMKLIRQIGRASGRGRVCQEG